MLVVTVAETVTLEMFFRTFFFPPVDNSNAVRVVLCICDWFICLYIVNFDMHVCDLQVFTA